MVAIDAAVALSRNAEDFSDTIRSFSDLVTDHRPAIPIIRIVMTLAVSTISIDIFIHAPIISAGVAERGSFVTIKGLP